jgi:16S rRNA (guanine966-N2)-methyltransferase
VRVIGGSLKRSKLVVADRPGLRPTPDRVRETLFNWLAPVIEGARVLDLCAGTGVLGIEAVSRGAAFAWLNEADGALAAEIAHNAERLKISAQVRVSRVAAERLLATRPEMQFDIAFVDPPYNAGLWAKILERLPAWLTPRARVYLEHPAEIESPITPNWTILKESRAGRVHFFLLEQAPLWASLTEQPTAESAP